MLDLHFVIKGVNSLTERLSLLILLLGGFGTLSAQVDVSISATPVLLGEWAGTYEGLVGARIRKHVPIKNSSDGFISLGYSSNLTETHARLRVIEFGLGYELSLGRKFNVLLCGDFVYWNERMAFELNKELITHENKRIGFKPSMRLSWDLLERLSLQVFLQQFHDMAFTIGPGIQYRIHQL